jgi:hypothetical protein
MLEQTQFPFSSEPYTGGIENSSVDTKSSKLTSVLVFVILAASIIGGIYYLNLNSDRFHEDKLQQ